MELKVIENNGNYVIDSRQVAIMIGKSHADLLKDIRRYSEILTESDFPFSDYFIKNEYIDPTGRTLPCYLCTRSGCEMIANKLTGKKGIIFTATYIEAFRKMETYIKDSKKPFQNIPFLDLVKSIEVVAESLKVNQASKNLMYKKFYEAYGQPSNFLPYYEFNGNREMDCATNLLKQNKSNISVHKFNKKMCDLGYIERKTRQKKNGKNHSYNSLTDKGLKYGENAINPHNQSETQPLYYKDTFNNLFLEIFEIEKN